MIWISIRSKSNIYEIIDRIKYEFVQLHQIRYQELILLIHPRLGACPMECTAYADRHYADARAGPAAGQVVVQSGRAWSNAIGAHVRSCRFGQQ